MNKEDQTDNTNLIRLLKDKNKESIPLLYKKYGGALLHLILRIIPKQELAEEVLQDVFVKVWKKSDQYDSEKGRLFTWMAQIARTTSIDKVRSGGFQRSTKTDSIESLVNKDELGVERPQILDIGLQRVINTLDEDHRILIDYLYFQGYSQSEAGKALGIPLGTVKSRVRKAIMDLRKILTKEELMLLIIYLGS